MRDWSKRQQKEIILQFREWTSKMATGEKSDIFCPSLESSLVLTFLIKKYYNNKQGYFKPIANHYVFTFPNENLFERGLLSLLQEKIVFPSTKTSFQKFEEFADKNGEMFYRLLMTNDHTQLAYIDSISVLMRNFNWVIAIEESSLNDIYKSRSIEFYEYFGLDYMKIWEQIIIEDCLVFASQNCYKLVSQKINPSLQWVQLFRELSQLFTLGQILKIIYQCSTYSLRIMQENGVDTLLYQRLLFDNIKNYAEKAISNDWKITSFESRPTYLPQSILSEVFFKEILKYQGDSTNLEYNVDTLINLLKRIRNQ